MFKVFGLVSLSFALVGNAVSGVLLETQSDRYFIGAQQQILLADAEVAAKTEKLFNAVKNGDIETVRALIADGVDVNVKTKNGWAPLQQAVLNGHIELVDIMLAAGADINTSDKNGWTPLHRAGRGNLEVLKSLLVAGADVNIQEKVFGRTPLYMMEFEENLMILLATDVDINAKDKYGQTPLHQAVGKEHLEVFKSLLVAGADVNAKDDQGFTPLHLGVILGNLGAVKELLIADADINAKDETSRTPLEIAVLLGNMEIVKALKTPKKIHNPAIE